LKGENMKRIHGIEIQWAEEKVGFGCVEIEFYDNGTTIDDEYMGQEWTMATIKQAISLLQKLVDDNTLVMSEEKE